MKLLNGIGLGTFPFAGPFGEVIAEDASKIIREYIKKTGKYFDVAPTYGNGQIEELLGRELKEYSRHRFFINTSCGYVLDEGKFVISGKYNDVISDCEASLKRLGIDYIDLYISHIPDNNTPYEETIDALKTLKKQGKIKKIGVSNVNLEQLKRYNYDGSVDFIQNRFSLLNQSVSVEFEEYLKTQRIGFIAYQVLERGLLTNKILKSFEVNKNDLRSTKPEFQENIKNELALWVNNLLYPIADKYQISITTLALKWCLKQSFVSLCQCGATKVTYLDDFFIALNKILPSIFYEEVTEAYCQLDKNLNYQYGKSVRGFMGLEDYDIYSGSSTGKRSY